MPDDRGITLVEARLQLARWMTADAELAAGAQSSRINTGGMERQVTRADAAEIRENVKFWDAKVRELSTGGQIPVYGVIVPWS